MPTLPKVALDETEQLAGLMAAQRSELPHPTNRRRVVSLERLGLPLDE
jgi:hypothetical protein